MLTHGLSILPWHGGAWMALRSNLPLSHASLHRGVRDAKAHVSAAKSSMRPFIGSMVRCPIVFLYSPRPYLLPPGCSPPAPGRRNVPGRFTVGDGGRLDTPRRTVSRKKAPGRAESTHESVGALSGGGSVHVSLSSRVSSQVRLFASHFPFRFLGFPFKCNLVPFQRFPMKRKFERKGGSVRNVSEVSLRCDRRRL